MIFIAPFWTIDFFLLGIFLLICFVFGFTFLLFCERWLKAFYKWKKLPKREKLKRKYGKQYTKLPLTGIPDLIKYGSENRNKKMCILFTVGIFFLSLFTPKFGMWIIVGTLAFITLRIVRVIKTSWRIILIPLIFVFFSQLIFLFLLFMFLG